MDFSRQVNYQSDFDVLLHVKDAEGNDVGFPAFDFFATFTSTGGGKKVEAGQVNGVKRGMKDVDGEIQIAFDNHGLMPGKLELEFQTDVENAIYPDGKKLTVFKVPTDITLTNKQGDESTGLKIDVMLPFTIGSGSSSSSSSEEQQ